MDYGPLPLLSVVLYVFCSMIYHIVTDPMKDRSIFMTQDELQWEEDGEARASNAFYSAMWMNSGE